MGSRLPRFPVIMSGNQKHPAQSFYMMGDACICFHPPQTTKVDITQDFALCQSLQLLHGSHSSQTPIKTASCLYYENCIAGLRPIFIRSPPRRSYLEAAGALDNEQCGLLISLSRSPTLQSGELEATAGKSHL